MIIYTYITKYQAFDKVIPLLVQITAKDKNVKVYLIVNLENKTVSGQLEEFSHIAKVSGFQYWDVDRMDEKVWNTKFSYFLHIIGKRLFNIRLTRFISFAANWIMVSFWESKVRTRFLNSLTSYHERKYEKESIVGLVLPGYARKRDPIGTALSEFFDSNNAIVFGYFKSLTDRGKGLSAKENQDNSNKKVVSITKSKLKKTSMGKLDGILYYTEEHRKFVQDNGFFRGMDWVVTGMPSQQRGWVRAIKELYVDESDVYIIVIFTRGKTGSSDGGYYTQDCDAVSLVSRVHEFMSNNTIVENWRIIVKPHPYQNISYLKLYTDDLMNVLISQDPPFKLACTADIAIGMFTNAIIDTISLGIVSIDRVYENESFFNHHPSGSPFASMGALTCVSDEEMLGIIGRQIEQVSRNEVSLENEENIIHDEWVSRFLEVASKSEIRQDD